MLRWTDVRRLASGGGPPPPRRDERPDEEWRGALSPERYRVLRSRGTERPFSSEMCSRFEPGRYACAGCGTVLFEAAEKFESGTGWPSFAQPARPDVVAYHEDRSFGMTRIEALCAVCDGHLGHVFPDGPPPGGLRYCINALALEKLADEAPPERGPDR